MRSKKFQKKSIVLTTLTAFLFLMTPFSTLAEVKTGNIKGFLYEKDGKSPCKKCLIILEKVGKEYGDRKYKSQPTGDNGEYQLNNIPEGVYKVSLIPKDGKKGLKTLTVVKIKADQTIDRSFLKKRKRPFFIYIPCIIALGLAGVFFII